MNWKQVKNLLLLLLIAVNLLLVYLVVDYYTRREFTDAATAEQAVRIFEKSGISVDAELLAIRNESANVLTCDYDREEYLCFAASLLFGEEAEGIYLLPTGIRAETRSGKKADLGFDFSLFYTDPGIDMPYLESAMQSAVQPEDQSAVQDTVAALEHLLALPSGALSDTPCLVADDFRFFTVHESEFGIPLYGMECTFAFMQDKLVYAEGKYCFYLPEKTADAPLLNRTNILFSEKDRGRTGRVTDIALCYTLYENAQSGTLLYIPSYTLSYADGTSAAVSAISGEEY